MAELQKKLALLKRSGCSKRQKLQGILIDNFFRNNILLNFSFSRLAEAARLAEEEAAK